MRIAPLMVLFAGLVACTQEDLLERFSSQEDQATAKGYIDRLKARDFEAIEKDADPSIKSPNLRSSLERIASQLPEGAPTAIKLVGAHKFSNAHAAMTNTTFEYTFGDKWFLINVAVQDKAGVKTIVGFNVVPESQSLEAQNRFTLSGKSVKHYAFLAAAVIAALTTLLALVACVRTKLSGRKWPWVLFILLGVGKLGLNWSTGEVMFAPLSVQLFSASAAAALNGPWIVAVSLPVGAVVFLIYRRVRFAEQLGG